jgi:hypothetical protein
MVVKSSTDNTMSPIPLKAEGRARAMAELGIPEGFRGRQVQAALYPDMPFMNVELMPMRTRLVLYADLLVLTRLVGVFPWRGPVFCLASIGDFATGSCQRGVPWRDR